MFQSCNSECILVFDWEIFNPEYSISPDAIYSLRGFAVYDIRSKKCEHLLFQQNLVREFDTVQGMKSSRKFDTVPRQTRSRLLMFLTKASEL
jgi:hypothetical protein